MARSRKKTTTQRLVGAATAGMPAPVQRIVGSRWGAPLLLLLLGAGILGSGIVTVHWSEGRPSVSIDRQRASEIKQTLKDRVASIRKQGSDDADASSAGDVIRRLASQQASGSIGTSSSSNEASRAGTGPTDAPLVAPPTATLGGPPVPTSQAPSLSPTASPLVQTIKIATFNIQVFGTSKLQKTPVMQVLADVVRRFDVVAIQEVRSTDDTVVPQFVSLINATGVRYDFVIGPRLGRTNSKEQYAILFDTSRIEIDPSSVYTAADPQDLLHREPLVARFRPRVVPPNQAFTFSLVNIHTDPDETDSELDALAGVFTGVQGNGSGEDDVILLGDLNVDEYHLGNLGRLPGIGAVVAGVPTNTLWE